MWKNLSKCVEKFFFHTLGQIFKHLDKFFNNDRDFHRKKPENLKKHSPSLIVLSQCSKNYPRIICFFSGFSIRKMAASDHSEVSAYGLDLKKNLGSHFRNLKTLEKSKLYLDNFSSHLEKTMREGKYHFLYKVSHTCYIKVSSTYEKYYFVVIIVRTNRKEKLFWC